MKAKVIKIFFSVVLLIGLSCKNEPTKTEHRAIKLTAEDASCIEAWLRIEVWTKPSTVILQKGDSTIATLQLTTMDTVIVDEGLQPSQTYRYTAQLITPIPPVWLDDNLTSQVQVQTMDTTSHDFRWEIYTLGDGTGSSCLYDVAIINDTLAYAVGEIYQDYNKDYQIYNAAKWNGRKWELMRIPFIGSCSAVDYPPLKAIWAFSSTNILVTNGGSIVTYDGVNGTMDCRMNSLLTGAINKIWATSPSDVYIVGNNGLIAHYDGSRWRRIESGTELQFLDIFGATDPKTGDQQILAVCTQNYPGNRGIYSIKGNTAIQISSYPIQWELFSVWFVPNRHYYVVGGAYYEKRMLTDYQWKKFYPPTRYAASSIRGNKINDVVIVGAYGECMHWNGIGWRSYQNVTGLGNGSYASIAIKNNLLIAVGENNARAITLIGRR